MSSERTAQSPSGSSSSDAGKPELRDGFIQLAYELDAALDLADFTKAERIVLNAIKAQTYGASKHRAASISISRLAASVGGDRRWVAKGLQSLIVSGVVKEAGAGLYQLNKYYLRWLDKDGDCRFSLTEIGHIKRSKPPGATAPTPPGATAPTPPGATAPTPPGATAPTPPGATAPTPLIEERTAEEFKKTSEDSPEYVSGAHTQGRLGIPQAQYPVHVDPQAPNLTTPEERAELDAVCLLCEVYFPILDDIRRVVSQRQGNYPVHAYRAAVEILRDQDSSKFTGKYLLGIIKTESKKPAPRGSVAGKPPTKAQLDAIKKADAALATERYRQMLESKKGIFG